MTSDFIKLLPVLEHAVASKNFELRIVSLIDTVFVQTFL